MKITNVLKNNYFVIALLSLTGASIRLYFVLIADFPLSDGGMFYAMVKDLIANNFAIPRMTSYNYDQIPFAYSPLTFYLAGIIHEYLNISLIDIFRYVPWLFSVFTIPLFYILSKDVMSKNKPAIMALVVYVLSPRSFQSLILGGGLTRAAGLFFAMLSLIMIIRYYKSGSKKNLYLAGLYFGLCLLSHMEFALFTAVSSITFIVTIGKNKKFIFPTIIFGLIGLLIASPWWMSVIRLHGLMPFISALQSNPRDAISTAQLGLIAYAAEPKFNIFFSFSLIGALFLAAKKNYGLLIWVCVIIASISRQSHTFLFIPLAMMAGFAIYELRQHVKLKYSIVLLSIIVSLIFSFISAFGHEFTPFAHLPRSEREAMAWIKNNTGADSKFIIVSAYPGWAWFLDVSSEWFPAVAERKSLATVQAYEWLPDFAGRLALNSKFKKCNDYDVDCLIRIAQEENLLFTHIYVSKKTKLETDLPACCSLLIKSITAFNDFRLIFENEGAYIFEYRLSQSINN